MLIYDKKDNKSIDVYTIEPKQEELKRYRQRVLHEHKNNDLLYYLCTNFEHTLEDFSNSKEINLNRLHYHGILHLNVDPWSEFYPIEEYDLNEEVLEKYIEGHYDSLHPIKTFNSSNSEIHRLLKTEKEKIVDLMWNRKGWEIRNIINLPRDLYLLHLLLHERFDLLAGENIESQLQLFDINYLKNVKLSDIQEMLDTGLVSGSIEDAKAKARFGSAVLKKAKKL